MLINKKAYRLPPAECVCVCLCYTGLFPFVLLFFRKAWAWMTGTELPDETTHRKESAFSAAVLEKAAADSIEENKAKENSSRTDVSDGRPGELRHRQGADTGAGAASPFKVGEVTVIDSEEQWLETLAVCSKAGRVAFVKFTAVWCGK